ncbi:hypothetical protein CBS101457_004551 [Exobasidium rhododendri]|nr:hypothetical protein CBS101457_004551 [Exobasidium rhododendri]
MSSLDVKASDTAVLTQYPSSLVRLLVLLAPVISLSAQFVRLATWTAGPGTASHSFLLLLTWWAICLYGYETLRYAPQAVLLSVILYNGITRAFRGVNKKSTSVSKIATSESINVTIDNLATLADFSSALSSTLLEPLASLFTWRSFDDTKAATIFLVTTWPIWLLCFGRQIWDVLGLPRVALQFRHYVLQLASIVAPDIGHHSRRGLDWSKQQWPTAMQRGTKVHGFIQSTINFIRSFFSTTLYRVVSSLPAATNSSSLHITILPPFPLFSLSVRHLFLVLGTLALTWCSPWCALIRHALWRSALVRQSTRKTIAILSGRRMHHLGATPPLPDQDSSIPSHIFEKDPFGGLNLANVSESNDAKQIRKNVTRHEDVIYQFTVFENQRWWMGLDWTAALLPQERPSWADESNNPVSPPSSFSLPPVKTTLKPAPTSSNPNAYTKRMVRWQWVDAEWIVAGREGNAELLGSNNKNRRASSTSSSTLTSGTLFSNSTTGTTSPAAEVVDGEDVARMSNASLAGELPSDLQWLDVDSEGWQYGDNSWEKMSRKGGLGRYTRRRRWIRRAVLVEVVQKNFLMSDKTLQPSEGGEGESTEIEGHKEEETPKASAEGGHSPSLPSSPLKNGGDLKQRLVRAAQGPSV